MKILVPIDLTPAMFGAGTSIPEVDTAAGEVAWAAGSYAIGDRRTDAGYTYECVKPVTAAPENARRPSDVASAVHWLKDENAPTSRMAPFDDYLFTKARRTGSLTYVLNPGFVTGFAMYGVEADSYEVTYRESPGGAVLLSSSGTLYEQASGLWEYLFGDLQKAEKWTSPLLPLRPNGELTITLSRNTPTEQAALGWLGVGQWHHFMAPNGNTGAAQYGIEVTPKDYGYYKPNDDGTYRRKPGRKAKSISGSAVIAAAQAPAAEAVFRRVSGTAVAVDFSDMPRYRHLGTVGFITGSVVSDQWVTARINFKIEGNV